jgi:hypothetical protein
LVHDGFATLRIITDTSSVVVFDPHDEVEADAVVLSGGPWAERWSGLTRVPSGVPVVAPRGASADRPMHAPPATVGGVALEALAYAPYEYEGGQLDRVRAALRHPRFATDRIRARRGVPDVAPHAYRISVPNGHTLVHLGLALHRGTTAAWLDSVRPWVEAADNVIAGYPHGEGEAAVRHLVNLAPKRVLFMDQVNDLRRAAGLDVQLLTPHRDALMDQGVETHVFVSGVSLRFEEDDTVKRW